MPNKYIWQTNVRGQVHVNDPKGREVYLPTLMPPKSDRMDEEILPLWKKICVEAARGTVVPPSWLLAFVYQDLMGYETVQPTQLGMAGLRAPSFEAKKPELQKIGLQMLVRRLSHLIDVLGLNLPTVASAYVAGTNKNRPWLSDKSPWGYREPSGYILGIVSANNYAITRGMKNINAFSKPEVLATLN